MHPPKKRARLWPTSPRTLSDTKLSRMREIFSLEEFVGRFLSPDLWRRAGCTTRARVFVLGYRGRSRAGRGKREIEIESGSYGQRRCVMCIGIGFGLNLNRCILILEWIYGRFGETGDYWVFFLVFMGHARDFLMYIGIIITRNY